MPPFLTVIVDERKLRDYCPSPSHPRGRHKARVFRSRLGMTAADTQLLRDVLLEAATRQRDDLRATDSDDYGQRYVLDFEVTTSTVQRRSDQTGLRRSEKGSSGL